jgi:hypothetical protein
LYSVGNVTVRRMTEGRKTERRMIERRMTEGRKLPKVVKTECRSKIEKDCLYVVFYRVRSNFMFYYIYTEDRKRINISSTVIHVQNMKIRQLYSLFQNKIWEIYRQSHSAYSVLTFAYCRQYSSFL